MYILVGAHIRVARWGMRVDGGDVGGDRHEGTRKEVIIKTRWDRARGATLLVLGPVPEPFHLIRLDII